MPPPNSPGQRDINGMIESLKTLMTLVSRSSGSVKKSVSPMKDYFKAVEDSHLYFRGMKKDLESINEELASATKKKNLWWHENLLAPVGGMVAGGLKKEGGLAETAGSAMGAGIRALAGSNPIGVAIAIGFMASIGALIFVAKKTSDAFKSLSSSIGGVPITLSDANVAMITANKNMFKMGVSTKDTMALVGALGDNMAINLKTKTELGMAGIVDAASEFLRLSNAAGMTSEDANKLAISLISSGTTIRGLGQAFIDFKRATISTALAPKLLAQNLATLAPVSLTVSGAITKTIGLFNTMRGGFDAFSNSLLRGITAEQKAKLYANSIEGLSQAMAGLNTPMMMAFGGGMGGKNKVDPWEAMQTAAGTDRGTVLMNYLDTVAKQSRGQPAAIEQALEGMGIKDLGTAVNLTRMIINRQRAREEGADPKKIMETNLQMAASLNTALQNPIERLVALVTQQLGVMMNLLEIFKPGRAHQYALNFGMGNSYNTMHSAFAAPVQGGR